MKKFILYFNGWGAVSPVGAFDTVDEAKAAAGIGHPVEWRHTPEWTEGQAWLGLPCDGAPNMGFTYSIFYEDEAVIKALAPRPVERPPLKPLYREDPDLFYDGKLIPVLFVGLVVVMFTVAVLAMAAYQP